MKHHSKRINKLAQCCWFLLLALGVSLVLPDSVPRAAGMDTVPPDDAPGNLFLSDTPQIDQAVRDQRASPPPAPPVNVGGGVWLAQGPGPSLDGQVENISPNDEVSGAIHTVAAHPTNPDILFAGAANGGIWKTSNATAASPFWTPLTDFESSLSIGALEWDPTDMAYQTLVAGIGRYSSFGQRGGARTGLLKTADGGASWSVVDGGGSLSGIGVSGVAPRGNTIVVASNVADFFTCGNVGIWRSTNGGTSFTKLGAGAGVPFGVAHDLAGDPVNPAVLYTAITFGTLCSGLSNGIYKSSNSGASWTKVSSAAMDALIVDVTTNNIEIAAHGLNVFANIIQDGQTAGVYYSANGGTTWTAMDLPTVPEGSPATIANVTPGTPIGIQTLSTHGLGDGDPVQISGVGGTAGANGVFSVDAIGANTFDLRGSSDATAYTGGGTWQKVAGMNPRNKPGGQGSIHASIRVDPLTPTRVYVGGDRQDWPFPNYVGALDYSGNLYRGDATTAVAGTSPSPQWDHLTHSDSVGAIPGGGTASSSAPHADSREMVFDAAGNLVEVDDGGIYRRTSPGGNTGDWFSINGNIQVTEQHDVAYDAVSNIIISGNQDTGTTQQQSPGSLTWDSVSTADGGDVAVDDISTPGRSYRYSSFQNLGAFHRREYDAANTLQSEVSPPLSGASFSPQFVTPVVVNAVSGARLVIAGASSIVESLDRGNTASNVSSSGGLISSPEDAIAYGGRSGGVANPDVLYVGSSTEVFVRTTGGSPLTKSVTYSGTSTVQSIVLDPDEWKTAFVVDSSTVYTTTDNGTSWTDITGNLTDTALESAAYIPGSTDRLVVGGRNGVFVLDLPPAAVPVWGELGTGLPNAPVWDMKYNSADNVLVVGTLGRGAWTLQFNGACGLPDNLWVRNEIVDTSRVDKACTSITAGPAMQVTGVGTALQLVAGSSVHLAPGFAVGNGATLGIGIDPGVGP